MTHALRQMIVSLRCECAANEVLQMKVVMDMDISEEHFLRAMKQLWRDVKYEVEQHLKSSPVSIFTGEKNESFNRSLSKG